MVCSAFSDEPSKYRCHSRKAGLSAAFVLLLSLHATLAAPDAGADEAQWIWANGSQLQDPVSEGETCFFRKLINLRVQAEGKVEISADDNYVLYVNGHEVGKGNSIKHIDQYEITKYLQVGRNIVAVKVANTVGDTAAMAARVAIRPTTNDDGEWFNFNSDSTWRTSTDSSELWETTLYNDRLWQGAATFGQFGETAPWDQPETPVVNQELDRRERFQIQKGFGVQRVLNDEKIGSVIAMTFNEFGHIILSQENGPLLLVFDQDQDGVPETVRTYCEDVQSCQGILALNGEVFVTGQGPEGAALYRLTDEDRNGTLDKIKTLVKFQGSNGELGAHGLQLGPDGMLYVVLGNYVTPIGEQGVGQTYDDPYEGDLTKRYEDPTGHAKGIRAPGGTVIRTNTEGTVVETIAGGLRNAYDLAFSHTGALFVHDSDMEADLGSAWYRPNAVLDITEGGEYGWRSGWAKWPEHYLDRLPILLDTGRGSPTGSVAYEHYMFPVRYQNTFFLADWSEGKILNVKIKRRGASYTADSEVFLQGQPLNVTDLEVGPDGAVYFCTGGRGTAGSVYRVFYKGDVPDRMKKIGEGIARAVRQPQLRSAWARQEIAGIKRELGDEWSQLVAGVAYSDDNPAHYRLRAMELMQLFGPAPSEDLILELSKAGNELVRARAAMFMGLYPSERGGKRLEVLLSDDNPFVRRAACEALLRAKQSPDDVQPLIELLAEDDRTLSFVARRVLENTPFEKWRDNVLNTPDVRVTLQGTLALVNAQPNNENGLLALQRISELLTGFLSDADLVDALRVSQVILHRTNIDRKQVAAFGDQIAEEFPAGDSRINHELIRLCAYLDTDSIAERALDYLSSDAKLSDRTLVAMYLQFFSHNWNAKQRFQILRFYEKIANDAESGTVSMYVSDVTRDFASSFSDDDIQSVLEQGHVWRNASLAAIYKLQVPIDEATTQLLLQLDQRLLKNPKVDDVQRRLRTGIIAMLATSSEPEAAEYLRARWRKEPERRSLIAMALSVKPEGENWDYLVRSLNILEEQAIGDVIGSLLKVRVATDDPMALRQLILLGVRQEQKGNDFKKIEKLLQQWTGMQRPENANVTMRLWQKWYSKTYPDRPAAVLPNEELSRWDFDQLVTYLDSDRGKYGDPIIGRSVFSKAKCNTCHRFGNFGDSIGPDLSGIARRFTKREILESVLYPSHIISDRYASKKVLTIDGRTYIGLLTEKSNGTTAIRDSKNQVAVVDDQDIDQILPSNASSMPSGLFDELSLQEISDLMSYLGAIPPLEVATRPKSP